MAHSLARLQTQRQNLLDQITALPVFRRGTVLERARSCGKPSCACANDAAHAHMQYLWSVSEHGKTRSRNLHLGPEVEKFLAETEAYRQFLALVDAYMQVNEQIADLQPIPIVASDDALDALKKKTAVAIGTAIEAEVHKLVAILNTSITGEQGLDFDAIETRLRDQALAIGRAGLEAAVRMHVAHTPVVPAPCACGCIPHHAGMRTKTAQTVLGPIALRRSYYHAPCCGHGQSPYDALLDIVGTSFSPGLRNMMANVGSDGSFDHGATQLARLAGVQVAASSIERVCARVAPEVEAYRQDQKPDSDARARPEVLRMQTMYVLADGTGVPVLKRETAGRKGKGRDGQARTRELKLGCVFTQTRLDEDGYPVRDENTTTYVVGCETAKRFGERLAHEARVRGIDRVRRICVIGDGAAWIWNMVADHFPGATCVIDLYHAREHYATVARLAFPGEANHKRDQWCERRKKELDGGDVKAVIRALKALTLRSKAHRKERDSAIGYFLNNANRMQYKRYRKLGLFVGSGVVEAGCRTVVGQRLKQSGMHWTVQASHNIAGLRALMLSGLWDDYWESRQAA